MTAIGQVKRAVVKAVAEAGCAATAAYGAEELKRYERAVAAVGVRETRITKAGLIGYLGRRTDERTQETAECYGRRMELSVSLDIYAPRTLGAQGCEDAAETAAQALTTALPEGLRLRAALGRTGMGQDERDVPPVRTGGICGVFRGGGSGGRDGIYRFCVERHGERE